MIALRESNPEEIPLFVKMETADDTAEFIFGWDEERHREEMRKNEIVYLSIVHQEELAGFFILALEPDGKSVEFRRIVVSKKGEGIGQHAIRAMEGFCAERLGRSKIWLDVLRSNSRGRHIYEKLGYEMFREGEQEGKQLLFYKKDLHADNPEP